MDRQIEILKRRYRMGEPVLSELASALRRHATWEHRRMMRVVHSHSRMAEYYSAGTLVISGQGGMKSVDHSKAAVLGHREIEARVGHPVQSPDTHWDQFLLYLLDHEEMVIFTAATNSTKRVATVLKEHYLVQFSTEEILSKQGYKWWGLKIKPLDKNQNPLVQFLNELNGSPPAVGVNNRP